MRWRLGIVQGEQSRQPVAEAPITREQWFESREAKFTPVRIGIKKADRRALPDCSHQRIIPTGHREHSRLFNSLYPCKALVSLPLYDPSLGMGFLTGYMRKRDRGMVLYATQCHRVW